MPYLIDGHNLIPKMHGLSLDDLDDEMQLVEMLQQFCQRSSKQVEVFFDNAAPGGVAVRRYGRVLARFVYRGVPADQAIINRLKRLGGERRNWTVVSSDRGVQAAAREGRAQVLSSEEFASLMQTSLDARRGDTGENAGAEISEKELDDWLKLFDSQEED